MHCDSSNCLYIIANKPGINPIVRREYVLVKTTSFLADSELITLSAILDAVKLLVNNVVSVWHAGVVWATYCGEDGRLVRTDDHGIGFENTKQFFFIIIVVGEAWNYFSLFPTHTKKIFFCWHEVDF